jgi:hypothetical protein
MKPGNRGYCFSHDVLRCPLCKVCKGDKRAEQKLRSEERLGPDPSFKEVPGVLDDPPYPDWVKLA